MSAVDKPLLGSHPRAKRETLGTRLVVYENVEGDIALCAASMRAPGLPCSTSMLMARKPVCDSWLRLEWKLVRFSPTVPPPTRSISSQPGYLIRRIIRHS